MRSRAGFANCTARIGERYTGFRNHDVPTRPENSEKFDVLYRRHFRSVIRFFLRLGFSSEESADLTQETFFRAYKGMDGYLDKGEVAWLSSIARNVYRNEIRSRRAEKRATPTVSLDSLRENVGFDAPSEAESSPVGYRNLLGKDLNRHLKFAIDRLPSAMRQCLLLRMQGLSYNELAKILDIELDTVKSTLYQARKRLATDPELFEFKGDAELLFAEIDLAEDGSDP